MAGERIAIYKKESKIIEGDYGDFYNTISRTEAVERMAAAMCMRANRIFDCKDCLTAAKGDCEVRLYHNIAAAALDALLEAYRNE